MVNVSDEYLIFYTFRLQNVTESTWKILKLDWKTPGFFFFQRSGNPGSDFASKPHLVVQV